MAVTNRSAGKTTSMHDFLIENALVDRQFVVLYRKKEELSNSSIQFSGCLNIFKSKYKKIKEIKDKPAATKCIRKYIATINEGSEEDPIYVKKTLGFCVAMYDRDAIKKFSSLFYNVEYMFMDEFQIESGKYLKDEIGAFQSVYQSIARGGGEVIRSVRVFLLSNDVSLINPYYIYYKIPQRLKPGTRKLRGDGWLLIYEYNKDAAELLQKNIVNNTFSGSRYYAYSSGMSQLVATNAFIENLSGKSRYLFTIYYNDRKYGFRYYGETELMHVSTKIEPSCKTVFVFKDSDIELNRMIMRKQSSIWKNIAEHYEANLLRFENEECKAMMFDLLGIDILN